MFGPLKTIWFDCHVSKEWVDKVVRKIKAIGELFTKRAGGCEFDALVIGIVNAHVYTSCSFMTSPFAPVHQMGHTHYSLFWLAPGET